MTSQDGTEMQIQLQITEKTVTTCRLLISKKWNRQLFKAGSASVNATWFKSHMI